MTRSAFLRTLAGILAGTHTAGPVTAQGLPDLLRRCMPTRCAPTPPATTAPKPACCA